MPAETGGVWGQIARLRKRFKLDMERLPALVEKRLGKKRMVRVVDVWWCVRWNGRTYRGLTPAALLRALPKKGAKNRPAPPAKPPELPFGGRHE